MLLALGPSVANRESRAVDKYNSAKKKLDETPTQFARRLVNMLQDCCVFNESRREVNGKYHRLLTNYRKNGSFRKKFFYALGERLRQQFLRSLHEGDVENSRSNQRIRAYNWDDLLGWLDHQHEKNVRDDALQNAINHSERHSRKRAFNAIDQTWSDSDDSDDLAAVEEFGEKKTSSKTSLKTPSKTPSKTSQKDSLTGSVDQQPFLNAIAKMTEHVNNESKRSEERFAALTKAFTQHTKSAMTAAKQSDPTQSSHPCFAAHAQYR